MIDASTAKTIAAYHREYIKSRLLQRIRSVMHASFQRGQTQFSFTVPISGLFVWEELSKDLEAAGYNVRLNSTSFRGQKYVTITT